ncbi:MAG: 2-oxoglutarate dehydrogenase complex dihydrolipoyllysine-residue succinyltransferase [Phycisphaeraceae bacterium]|nr:2-oxoglutarate dehydrogenase complex dihydrolipoyllysine-residue succinyltransferase [Phycisphaeraceae bacterium]
MATPIVIPPVGESITSGVIQTWRVKDGDYAQRDDVLLDLETDKITVELRATAAGIVHPEAKEGDQVDVGAKVGWIDETATAPTPSGANAAKPEPAATTVVQESRAESVRATPLARKAAEERGVDISKLRATGPGERIREQDVINYAKGGAIAPAAGPAMNAEKNIAAVDAVSQVRSGGPGSRQITRERMSMLRQRVASRLVEAQHTAAMLTTFNECDMSAVLAYRAKYKEDFEKRFGVGLGFMSFFVKAACSALQSFPLVNASIVADEKGHPAIEKHDYCDIAIAVASPKGLVVPVIRNAELLNFAQIEQAVKDLATKAKDGKITLEDMTGGTFTITNGGIFGSLMSTPILNPPQSGILGMHAIKNRAVENPEKPGEVVIRPMMYLALSYDHRIIDGAEAVQFLVRIKNSIEDPRRLLLEL